MNNAEARYNWHRGKSIGRVAVMHQLEKWEYGCDSIELYTDPAKQCNLMMLTQRVQRESW